MSKSMCDILSLGCRVVLSIRKTELLRNVVKTKHRKGGVIMFQEIIAYIGDNMALCGAYAISILSALFNLFRKKTATDSNVVQEDLQKLIDYHEGVAKALKEKIKKE